MGLLSKDDLDYYLSQLGAYFAIMLRDNPGDLYKELYSHYDAVREHIQTLEKTNGWISVKDRLPDAAGYECLVCAVNENYNQTHVFTAHTGYGEPGWWTGNVNYMSRATSPSDNRLHPALNVTHWMPLPEPPQEEEHENDNR